MKRSYNNRSVSDNERNNYLKGDNKNVKITQELPITYIVIIMVHSNKQVMYYFYVVCL